MTSERANARTDVYNPASWALLKNEARKCDETVSDVPAKRVRNRNKISDVFVNKICVKRIEQARKPGKYKIRNDSIVDKILGMFVTICAAMSSAIVVCLSVATKTLR
jgi:anti-sigma28 factor (negative regulator of flagellin synthesis)